jgi:hypothetical protein
MVRVTGSLPLCAASLWRALVRMQETYLGLIRSCSGLRTFMNSASFPRPNILRSLAIFIPTILIILSWILCKADNRQLTAGSSARNQIAHRLSDDGRKCYDTSMRNIRMRRSVRGAKKHTSGMGGFLSTCIERTGRVDNLMGVSLLIFT